MSIDEHPGVGGERIGRLLAAAPGASGIVVGINRQDGHAFHCRGHTTWEGDHAINSTTRFEIGSLTKTFTVLLFAEQVARGEITHDTLLGDCLPSHLSLPPGGENITLTHLATHTSGLPRLPPGLLRRSLPRFFTNPYAEFTTGDVFNAVARTRLRARPGTRVRYSNFAVGILGHALEYSAHAGLSFEELLRTRILRPLDLQQTDCALVSDTPHATGYRHRRSRPPWEIPGLVAAGAVRSSARDLLALTHALNTPDTVEDIPDSLRSALKDVLVPRPLGRSQGLERALVWNVARQPGGSCIYDHSGATRGFSTFVGFNPQRRSAVVALANSTPQRGITLVQDAYDVLRDL